MPRKLLQIAERYVLLCEGQHDSQFFTHLIMQNPGLPAFVISSVSYVLGAAHGGNTRFTQALDELPAIPGFDLVERILIVADNDLDPVASFSALANQINATAPFKGPPAGRFLAPTAPQIKSTGTPPIVVLMLPWTNVVGNLDTLCLEAAMANALAPIPACVDEFARCTGADQWSPTALAKMKLRSFLSASWQANPYISPAYVWSMRTNLVPLNTPSFAPIINFLRQFPTI